MHLLVHKERPIDASMLEDSTSRVIELVSDGLELLAVSHVVTQEVSELADIADHSAAEDKGADADT